MNNPDSREPYPFDLPQPSTEHINLDVISSPETGLGRLDAEIPQRAELPQSTAPDPAATISNLPPSMLFTSPNPVSIPAEEKVDKEEKDLIAKEWVSRTKEIIATTRNDPYRQNRELFRIKADFMKTRYNKDVVMDEN